MVKRILLVLFGFATIGLSAQNGTISPYSYYGIGDFKPAQTAENQMMGGLGMLGDSIHINLVNPAAYGKLRLTVYAANLSRKEYRLKTYNDEQQASVTSLDYLAIAFPVSEKMGMGFGLQPYSSVGYTLSALNENQGRQVANTFTGEGGVNKAYFSVGYQVMKNLGIGATANFNFGNIESQQVQFIEDVQLGTIDRRKSRINGYNFQLGTSYTPKVDDNHTFYASAYWETQNNLVSRNDRAIGSVTQAGSDVEVFEVDLDAVNLRHTELKIPTTTTLGIGYGRDLKWFVGAEYGFQDMGSFENPFLTVGNVRYQEASTMALGGYFIPDYSSLTGYLNHVTYRAGLRYEKTGMVVNEKEINNFGITFGLGLPLGLRSGDFTNLNLGFELGRRGTTDAGLVEESYFKVNLGLSLNSRWFQKRRIN